MESAVVNDLGHCVVCGTNNPQIHHVFYGVANRKISDRMGYVIPLCITHHTVQPHGIHFNRDLDMQWKKICQTHFEANVGNRRAFIELFGKSYL